LQFERTEVENLSEETGDNCVMALTNVILKWRQNFNTNEQIKNEKTTFKKRML
jgi:hypothetical protein